MPTTELVRTRAEDAEDELSATFAALADPTRRAILARLAQGEATVNDLAEPFPISLQAVSKHLKVLERARLITRGRDAQWRPCRLETAPLATAQTWIAESTRIWNERLDRLDEHLQRIQRRPNDPRPPQSPTSTTSTTSTNRTTKKEPTP